MASARINSLKGSNNFDYFRVVKQTPESRNLFILNLDRYKQFECSLPLLQEHKLLINQFINGYQTTYSRIKSMESRKEYRDAFKRHRDCINGIVEKAISLAISNEVLINDYIEIKSKVIITIDGEAPCTTHVQPRSFRKLYEIMRVLLTTATTSGELLVNARIITTVSSLYNDLRLSPDEMDAQMREDIDTLKGESKFVSNSQFESCESKDSQYPNTYIWDIKETCNLLKEFTESRLPLSRLPEWSRDMVYALRRVKFDDFSSIKLKESSHSSGTSYFHKTYRRTMPAFLASVYETDIFKNVECIKEFDSITGNKTVYRNPEFDYLTKVKSKERNSVCIEQKKPKGRLIHTLANPSQDRLTYFEKIDQSILYNLKEDCTKNQSNGPEFIKSVMKDLSGESIYSLDLTDATNTMLVSAQKFVKRMVLSLNFDPDTTEKLVTAWEFLMVQETSFKFNNGDTLKYKMSSGQPMGYSDSFASFALTHHICMLTLLRLYDPNLDPYNTYRILGDDLVIVIKDEGFKVPALYSNIMRSVNVECNIHKGYLFNPDVEEYCKPIAEFAKYLIMDGYDMTPIPVKLLSYENIREQLGLLCWVQEHNIMGKKSGIYLLDFLRNNLAASSFDCIYYELLMSYNINNLLVNSFPYYKKLRKEEFRKEDLLFLLYSIKDNVNLSLINLYLKEGTLIKGYDSITLKGFGSIRKDIFNLYDLGLLTDTKLGYIIEDLEMIQLSSEVSIDILFKDSKEQIEDPVLLSLPIINRLRELVSIDEIIDVLDLLENPLKMLSFDDDKIFEVSQSLIKISDVSGTFHERSWSAYPKRIALKEPSSIFSDMSENLSDYFSETNSSLFVMLNNISSHLEDIRNCELNCHITEQLNKLDKITAYTVDTCEEFDDSEEFLSGFADLGLMF